MTNRLEELKKEMREKWRIRYTEDFQNSNLSIVEVLNRVDALATLIYTQAIQEAIGALPEENSEINPETGYPYYKDWNRGAISGSNQYRKEAITNLQALLPTAITNDV